VDIRNRENEVLVLTDKSEVLAQQVVTCGGLFADKLANMTLPGNAIQILPFRGEYYELIPSRQHLVNHLVYPVPNPDFPFLGVHFTRMIEGGVEAGPNAVLAFQREGYSLWDINLQEMIEAVQFSGFRKIIGKYWKEAADELYRSASKAAFVKSLQKLIPAVRSEDLVKGRAGVRAMACDPEGNLIDDFLFLSSGRTLHVLNAPSPAATASLSIGETIADKILEQQTFA
jgi:L-2-hydroxyglutarate oxidase